jgi:hypothetical protein
VEHFRQGRPRASSRSTRSWLRPPGSGRSHGPTYRW